MRAVAKLSMFVLSFLPANWAMATDCDQVEAVAAAPVFACTEKRASEIERLMNNVLDAGTLVGRHFCFRQREALAKSIAECRSINLSEAMNEATAYATDVAVEKVYLYRVARGAP